MSKIYAAKQNITSAYLSTGNTVDRFNMLQEIESLIKELRAGTIEEINSGTLEVNYSTQNRNLVVISKIFSDQSACLYENCLAFITPEKTIQELIEFGGLDSLDMIELVMAIEEDFDISISDEEAEAFNTVSDILDFIAK